ncbi:helix-turn-helix transcriptional regulator [Legionella sp. 16cNR16C]|uniref:helix-turn-helix domain-containing protein n=1 Tax=Legionella sp. 16cNR16C TaxID=2905656 RepID=UPI001E5191A6|nr:helix-turn-helix transcriptional regulator [Legionella sp. 16cNR16C]MCE3045424.1 helix-turn-helix transcriptional regulator [Legionella sp. 16cNR16C]
MKDIPYITSLAYKPQIEAVCKQLESIQIDGFVMYLIFNDGGVFILSNVFPILKTYYQECLYTEDFTFTPKLLLHNDSGHYFCEKEGSLSTRLLDLFAHKYSLHPVYNLVRAHSECTFVFSAITKKQPEDAALFFKRTEKPFEAFCKVFVDHFLDLIVEANPKYKFSFIFTNRLLRHAVISKGYEKEICLSEREQECLWYATQGRSFKEIGKLLAISPATVKVYIQRIREQFDGLKLSDILLECIHRGLIGRMNSFEQRIIRPVSLLNLEKARALKVS